MCTLMKQQDASLKYLEQVRGERGSGSNGSSSRNGSSSSSSVACCASCVCSYTCVKL